MDEETKKVLGIEAMGEWRWVGDRENKREQSRGNLCGTLFRNRILLSKDKMTRCHSTYPFKN